MSAKPVHALDGVLASIDARFDDEACALFGNSVFVVMKQIRDVPETDKSKHLETCHELFKVGQGVWLESLVKLVHGNAGKLTKIAESYPAFATGNPAEWITLQLK